MQTCALCQEEVTPRMIREGSALTRGADLYHRKCHRDARGRAPLAAPIPAPAAAGGIPEGTSFPDIVVASEPAGFWRRVGAHVVDGFILNVFVFFASFLMGLMAGVTGTEPSGAALLGGVIGLVVPMLYCVSFWVKKGATPGKMMLGIRVVREDGGDVTSGQSIIRYIGYLPSSLVLGLGYLWMLFDGEKRCWHDIMAGTRVVRV
jgi:uncharacterized RDD family membrane protein YckC